MASVWFGLSIGVFVATFIFAFKKKHGNLKAALKTVLIGIVITDFIMLSSLFYYGNRYDINGNDLYSKNTSETQADNNLTQSKEKPFGLIHSTEFEIPFENKFLSAIFYGLVHTLKMGSFSVKYSSLFYAAFNFPTQLFDIPIPNLNTVYLNTVYGIFIVILSLFTPLAFGGFLVSYIKSLWNFLLYHFLILFKNVYYFSDLNEKSLLLAESIVANEKSKPLIVFCNWDKVPGRFADRIDRNHFIVLPENEKDLIIHSKIVRFIRHIFGKERQYFFEISENDNRNLDSTNQLIKELLKDETTKNDSFDNLKIYTFMDSSLLGSEQLFESTQSKINIILVNEVKTSVYQLLFDNPFCEQLNDKINDGEKTLLSIAVFGDGAYAKEFFKDSIWASVLGDDYKTQISFIDKEVDSFKENLTLNCPSLIPYMEQDKNIDAKEDKKNDETLKLKFCQCNLHSKKFNKLLESELQHPDYIVIDTGDDEESINLAIYLRMFYIRKSLKEYARHDESQKDDFKPFKPFIAVKIKDSRTATRIDNLKVNEEFKETNKKFEETINELTDEKQRLDNKKQFEKKKGDLISYDIHSFGSDEYVYSYSSVIESPIDDLALNYYAAYKFARTKSNKKIPKNEAVFGCNISEFEKYSNKANAVHIKNKLFLMGLKLVIAKEWERNIDQTLMGKFKDKEWEEMLKKVEHERWKMFNFTEGWICPSDSEKDVIGKMPKDNNKKYVLARFHGGLCSEEDLDIEKTFIETTPGIIGYYQDKKNDKDDDGYINDFLNVAEIKNFSLISIEEQKGNKVKELSSDKLQDNSPYKLISGDAVRKYFKAALELDEKYYGKGNYTPFTEDKCNSWLDINKEIYTMIINKKSKELLGYINAVPVMTTCYEAIKKGNRKGENIEISDIKPYSIKSDDIGLFLVSFVVDKDKTDEEKRDYTNLLINAFCNKLTGLADDGFIITKIISYIVGVDNRNLTDDFGMKRIPEINSIYEVKLSSGDCEIPNPYLKAYQKHLKEMLKNKE